MSLANPRFVRELPLDRDRGELKKTLGEDYGEEDVDADR